jgi:hypothetical protein
MIGGWRRLFFPPYWEDFFFLSGEFPGAGTALPTRLGDLSSHYYQMLLCEQETFRMELTGLASDTEYEVRLRAMNSQGWSQLSSPFQFRTAGTNSQGSMKPTLYPLTITTAGADSHGWNQLYIYLASRNRQGVPSQFLNTFQFRRTGTKSRTSYCSEQKRRKARD